MGPNNYNLENRPKIKSYSTTFRHDGIIKVILDAGMDEYELRKSELLVKIIKEWNMLRYSGD